MDVTTARAAAISLCYSVLLCSSARSATWTHTTTHSPTHTPHPPRSPASTEQAASNNGPAAMGPSDRYHISGRHGARNGCLDPGRDPTLALLPHPHLSPLPLAPQPHAADAGRVTATWEVGHCAWQVQMRGQAGTAAARVSLAGMTNWVWSVTTTDRR